MTSVTYVGPGAIGLRALELIARLPGVNHITPIDHDVFEPHNLRGQAIAQRDIGRRKVDVVAARIRAINPDITVDTFAVPVEQVPLSALRADVIATGLDGLAARRTVSRAAWRLGIPWVDAGVRADGLLARVDVFVPGENAACLECAWSEEAHATLDHRYPCDGAVAPDSRAATDAPAHLGALAASLQSAECAKLLSGEASDALIGRQLLVEMRGYCHYVTRRERSPDCPFDHERWSIQALPLSAGSITLAEALSLIPGVSNTRTQLRLHDDTFVHRLVCRQCNASREILGLAGRLAPRMLECKHCRGPLVASGIDTTDTLRITTRNARLSLHALGLRRRDVFTVEGETRTAHFEIGG